MSNEDITTITILTIGHDRLPGHGGSVSGITTGFYYLPGASQEDTECALREAGFVWKERIADAFKAGGPIRPIF